MSLKYFAIHEYFFSVIVSYCILRLGMCPNAVSLVESWSVRFRTANGRRRRRFVEITCNGGSLFERIVRIVVFYLIFFSLFIFFFLSDQASFAAIVDGDGEVTDHLRLVHLTKRKNSFKAEERRLKVKPKFFSVNFDIWNEIFIVRNKIWKLYVSFWLINDHTLLRSLQNLCN